MELLDTEDAKSLLLRKTAKHKKELEDEVKLLSENTEKIITNTLVIAGTLAATYFIVRQFSKKKRKAKAKKVKLVNVSNTPVEAAASDEETEPGIVSAIGSALAAQATMFLLNLAKDKLSAYLQTQFDKEAEPANERP